MQTERKEPEGKTLIKRQREGRIDTETDRERARERDGRQIFQTFN